MMVVEDDRTVVDGGKGQDGAAAGEAKKKGKGPFLLIGISAAAVVIGIALALFVIKPMLAGSDGSGSDATAQVDDKEHGKKPSKKGHGGSEALIYEISNIVVNPAGTGGSRFLSASFGFDLGSPELRREFETREPIIRDALITILSSKTVAQLTDPKQKEIVRYQIKKRVSQLMATQDLAAVYYTDFVLQ
ncbi:MAG: flagellar basal body-associated FliL family protein [Candidatus Zixiibacteriota bacterium]|nr:MAG: flagellar basal body-associated FliL family protein [candidate division Zixibacteria bacterium]